GRARGLADAEYARGARAVELEQDAQGDDLALGRRELAQRCLELGRQPVAELLGQALVARIRLLAAAAARLGAEPVDGDAARDPAQPRARGTAARIEAPPGAERLLERLGGQILCGRAVARQIDEVAVHRVELLGGDLCEAGPPAGQTWHVERGRRRVHGPRYGTGPADRHTRSLGAGTGCG